MQENIPDLWRHLLPQKAKESHKYDHGYAVIYGSDTLTGATRLVATACARMGVGLVSVLCNPKVASIYKTALPPHIMVRDNYNWDHDKISVKIYGSGGLSVQPDYKSKIPTILDAEALYNLPDQLSENFILTPHDGEFQKAFPHITGNRTEKAVQAAAQMNAHIVLKGAETIIACPNGRHMVSHHAPVSLATAGTGDVLAGIIGGLVGQKMDIFHACNAAVWIHGECAYKFGKGLVASDLIDMLPPVLQSL